IAPGEWADLVALDDTALALNGHDGDTLLDAWIFAGDDRVVSEVWSAGRHVVQGGAHIARETVEKRYRETMETLTESIN
ncbi:MAG: formimidoylglutamate deiminase, partial [Pseudomonadota bacterium]